MSSVDKITRTADSLIQADTTLSSNIGRMNNSDWTQETRHLEHQPRHAAENSQRTFTDSCLTYQLVFYQTAQLTNHGWRPGLGAINNHWHQLSDFALNFTHVTFAVMLLMSRRGVQTDVDKIPEQSCQPVHHHRSAESHLVFISRLVRRHEFSSLTVHEDEL